MNPPDDFEIRPATPDDVPTLLALVRQLADYERLSDQVVATEDDFHAALFGERPSAEAILGFHAGRAVGFALFFQNFSTFLGRPGLYLEDLFIEEKFRGRGFGKALFLRLVDIARERGCGRMEWAALTWNTPAIAFYQSLGAEALDDWRTFRLTRTAIERLRRPAN
jgi:GNAT superfamily N-acetyltransferase